MNKRCLGKNKKQHQRKNTCWLCRNTRVLIKRRSMKQRATLSMEPEETEACLVKNVTLMEPRKMNKNLRLCWTPVSLTQRMHLVEYPSYRNREYFPDVPLLARLANASGWWELGFRNIQKSMFPIPAIGNVLSVEYKWFARALTEKISQDVKLLNCPSWSFFQCQ